MAANGTFHEKKFEGQNKEVMGKLKNEYEDSLKQCPDSIKKDKSDYLNNYRTCLDKELKKYNPIIGGTSSKMTKADIGALSGALGYSIQINDMQKNKMKKGEKIPNLYEKAKVDILKNPTYFPNYRMNEDHARNYRERINAPDYIPKLCS